MNDHLVPVGKPAPPRPRRPLALTSSMTSSGVMPTAWRRVPSPPVARYPSMAPASGLPHRAVRRGSNSGTGARLPQTGQDARDLLPVAGDPAPGRFRDVPGPDVLDHPLEALL